MESQRDQKKGRASIDSHASKTTRRGSLTQRLADKFSGISQRLKHSSSMPHVRPRAGSIRDKGISAPDVSTAVDIARGIYLCPESRLSTIMTIGATVPQLTITSVELIPTDTQPLRGNNAGLSSRIDGAQVYYAQPPTALTIPMGPSGTALEIFEPRPQREPRIGPEDDPFRFTDFMTPMDEEPTKRVVTHPRVAGQGIPTGVIHGRPSLPSFQRRASATPSLSKFNQVPQNRF